MKKVFNLIIVDESGSMGIIAREALSGMNETLATCRLMQEKAPEMEQRVTLVTFDSDHYKTHYDNAPALSTKDLTADDYRPGGCTPLYDAIGRAVAHTLAQTEKDDNVLVTIITDGYENCSMEYTLDMVKTLIAKQKVAGWTFSLIGTDNLDVEGMAKSMAIDNSLAFAQNEEGTREMFRRERSARENFNYRCRMSLKMPVGDLFKESEE